MLGKTLVGPLALALIVSLWLASAGLAQQAALQEAPAEVSLQLASIFSDHMVLQRDQVTAPVAVRYNWSTWTEGNLYNAEGLPASPFRTDRF